MPRLYQLLSTFSKEEMRAFRLFLQSPYFNKSEILLSLFDVIKKHHPLFDSLRLTKKNIHKKLKPTIVFNEKFINDRFSDLSKLVEEFMAIHLVKKDEKLKCQVLRKSLHLHHLDHLFANKTRKAIVQLEKNLNYSWEESMELWNLKYDLFIHPQTLRWDCKKDEAIEMIGHLDDAYIILKLRYGFHQKNRSVIFHKQEEYLFMDTLMDYAKKSKHPVIKLYHLLLNTFEKNQLEKNWIKAHEYYLQTFKKLPTEDQQAGLLGLINRGNKLAISGKPKFHLTILELFKFGLNKKILLSNGLMTEQTFKNIAMLGSGTGDLEWTAKFIKKYKTKLPQNSDPNITLICWAYYDFFSQNYDNCIDRLTKGIQLKTRDKLNYKSLELRCRYELYANDKGTKLLLDSLLDSYEQFLQRKKTELSSSNIKAYQNFVYLTKSLSKLTHSSNINRQVGRNNLREELNIRTACVAKNWVLQKIDTL